MSPASCLRMELLPAIIDFRSAGPAASKTCIIHNKHSVHVEVALLSDSGPFTIRCHEKPCQAELAATETGQAVTMRHLRVKIPPKEFISCRVELNSAISDDGAGLGRHHNACYRSGIFPVIPLEFPSETQCMLAVGLETQLEHQRLLVDKREAAFLTSHEVPQDTATRVLEEAINQLCQFLRTGTTAGANSINSEIEFSDDQGCTGLDPARLRVWNQSYDPKPRPIVQNNAHCHTNAFQAVNVEMNGRHACVVKVIPVPCHVDRHEDTETVLRASLAQNMEPGSEAKFQLCGKWYGRKLFAWNLQIRIWTIVARMLDSGFTEAKVRRTTERRPYRYDARGNEIAHHPCTKESGPSGSGALHAKQPEDSVKSFTMDNLRDAALAAAKAELGLSYIPESVRSKGPHGEHKPLLPVLKEARGGHVGLGSAGSLGQSTATQPRGLDIGKRCLQKAGHSSQRKRL